MAIGFVLSEQVAVNDAISYGVAAEQAGFERLWMADHFQPWIDLQGHAPQAWVALGALGQRTQHIPFGTSITCPIYRYRPTVVAQAFATLAALYPGRIFLGLGPGEARDEIPATGDWGDERERADRLVEAVSIIRRLWEGDRVTHHGRHFHISEARLYDLPATPVPLYIAAEGVESMRLAGRHGDGLITTASSAVRPELRAAFALGAREYGKDPARMPVLAELFVVVGSGAAKNVDVSAATSPWVVSTDPEAHAEAIRSLLDAGVGEIYIHAAQPDQRRAIEFYGREVLPRINGLRARAWGA
ncbi:MAG: TIGR03557 family F420-dependent LLM class oxidoreductase [Chloroflexales bacterium]|nr:TIGR03557 family F420-dependent LLM class oxidoreductase [Chloroflexales bacterium]